MKIRSIVQPHTEGHYYYWPSNPACHYSALTWNSPHTSCQFVLDQWSLTSSDCSGSSGSNICSHNPLKSFQPFVAYRLAPPAIHCVWSPYLFLFFSPKQSLSWPPPPQQRAMGAEERNVYGAGKAAFPAAGKRALQRADSKKRCSTRIQYHWVTFLCVSSVCAWVYMYVWIKSVSNFCYLCASKSVARKKWKLCF